MGVFIEGKLTSNDCVICSIFTIVLIICFIFHNYLSVFLIDYLTHNIGTYNVTYI